MKRQLSFDFENEQYRHTYRNCPHYQTASNHGQSAVNLQCQDRVCAHKRRHNRRKIPDLHYLDRLSVLLSGKCNPCNFLHQKHHHKLALNLPAHYRR